MPQRFGRLDLPGAPGVKLDPVQVSLQPLIRLLNVKTAQGFDLSSAIVPVVDVSKLIEGEAAAPKSLAFRAIDIPFRADNDNTQGFIVRASYTMKRPGRVSSAFIHARATTAAPATGAFRAYLRLTRLVANDPDLPAANRAFQAPVLFAAFFLWPVNTMTSADLAGPIALQSGDILEMCTEMFTAAPDGPGAADYRMFAAIEESLG